jgi:Fe-S-cluster containining protein
LPAHAWTPLDTIENMGGDVHNPESARTPDAPSSGRAASDRFDCEDSSFIALVDGAFLNAAARSGHHLLCRPGCTQCCIGVFPIGPADAARLEHGLRSLERQDPVRAERIRRRARVSWDRLAPEFPGDKVTGRLALSPNSGEPSSAFESFGNEEPCPVLDPESGTCDLYAARPHTCRIFGPPLPTDNGYGICDLCFTTATDDEIVASALPHAVADTPEALDQAAVAAGATPGLTVVSYVLRS